jgi:hypothetical protein
MTEPEKPQLQIRDDMVWPVIIVVALVLVVVVNAVFIYIAVTGADAVAPSYVAGQR